MSAENLTMAWVEALLDELAKAGVRHLVTSPGSRSAPLALAAAADARIEDRSILDERSAGFFALGLARATREPVAAVCTSGTAAANWLPAVVESRLGGTPLVLLSADRPAELRARGAPQTIDQAGLYGGYPCWALELPVPSPAAFGALRSSAARAVFEARAHRGPVHLNVPLREPLAPVPAPFPDAASAEPRGEAAWTRVARPPVAVPHAAELAELAAWIRAEERGWLVVGPGDVDARTADALARLARACGWPLLADGLSPLRHRRDLEALRVPAHEALLCAGLDARDLAPRRALRFGGIPTSKRLLARLDALETRVVCEDDWPDPASAAHALLRADPGRVADGLAERLGETAPLDFAKRCARAGHAAARSLEHALESATCEPAVVPAIARALPEGATLFVGNSLPVRDVDAFWPERAPQVRVLANRGANGIDGSLSCALGVAAGSPGPCLALLGDLSLLHDASGLIAAAQGFADLTLVLIDNRGGGIFETLPAARYADRDHFERHLATPQPVDPCALARGAGLDTVEIGSRDELEAALRRSIAAPGVQLLCVRSARRESAEWRRKLLDAAAYEALRA